MVVRRNLRIEDVVITLTVLLTFLYPLIITLLILYEENTKERKALKIMEKALSALTSPQCEERIPEIIPRLHVTDFHYIMHIKDLCKHTAGKKPVSRKLKRENGELIYNVLLPDGKLRIVGAWEDETFKIILIDYDKGD
ncbi:MAG: hypothetical protein GXO04_01335 [Aquificae bacterium]|nr:hypothetical protein [Aquificota bacterium]